MYLRLPTPTSNLLFLLLLTSILTPQAIELSTDSLKIRFDTNAPDVYFYPYSYKNDSYKLTWTRLEEIDSRDLSKVVQTAFFGNDFQYSDPIRDIIHGNAIQNTNMTANVIVGDDELGRHVMVNLSNFLYENSTQIFDAGGKNVAKVDEGNLQFLFELENWPWISSQNSLKVSFSITSNRLSQSQFLDGGRLVYLMGSINDTLQLKLLHDCSLTVNNYSQTIGVNIILKPDQPLEIGMVFPYFSHVKYSSLLGISFSTKMSPMHRIPFSTTLILILAFSGTFVLVFGVATAFFNWRRYKVRQHYLHI